MVNPSSCPVCKLSLSNPMKPVFTASAWHVDCPRCGEVYLFGQVADILEVKGDAEVHRRAITSHAIRRMQPRAGTAPLHLYREDLLNIWQSERLPTPPQQADLLILLLGRRQASGSDEMLIAPHALEAEIGSALRKDSGSEPWRYVVDYLSKVQRLLDYGTAGPRGEHLWMMLTLPGWDRYAELQSENSESRTAFMAMKFGRPELDELFHGHLVPAVDATGFRLDRLDMNPKPGLIDARMEVEIRAARFMIADLTHGSYGAYWEAGFAAGLGKPVFYMCEKGYFETDGSHFDTNHHYTVLWDIAEPRNAMEELKAAIRRSLPADAKLRD